MDYKDEIEQLVKNIPNDLVDFQFERKKGRKPTAAYSEFLTNRAQGDWAENAVLETFNQQLDDYVLVKYGVADDYVVGEPGFDDFYERYQEELRRIGKRPDLLLFAKSDYEKEWNYDIRNKSEEELKNIVPKAIAGFEIRSSSFIEEQYETETKEKTEWAKENALKLRNEVLTYDTSIMTQKMVSALKGMNKQNIHKMDFRIQLRNHASKEEVKERLTSLKENIKTIQKRDYLSFTPKMEDLSLVYKWIQTYGVPHYYIQVFYDRIYGMGFKEILSILSDDTNKNHRYYIEKDVKNQMKSTIKVNVKEGEMIGENTTFPEHKSVQKVFKKGRVVHYVMLEGGRFTVNKKKFTTLFPLKTRA